VLDEEDRLSKHVRCAVLCVGLFLFLSPGPASATPGGADSCRSALKEFVAALKQADITTASGLIEDIDLYCPPQNRIDARSNLGLLAARLARLRLEKGEDVSGVIADAEAFLAYGDHWELRRLLGELAMSRKRFSDATEQYFKALELIDDTRFTRTPPDQETILAVHDAASEALSLSSIPVEPTTRGGAPTPYFAPTVRGIAVPKKTPQITFVTNKAEFDPRGQVSAERLLPILRKETPHSVTVIGHTDDRGSDIHNLELSKRRALRLKDYLQANGFPGSVRVRWCGERVPVRLSNPGGYTQEERWQINRRVEVFYGQGGVSEERYGVCAQ